MIESNRKRIGIPVTLALALGLACSTTPDSEYGREDIERRAAAALTRAEGLDGTLAPMLRSMAAYAVIPEVNKGGVIIGAAYGRGVLYEKGVVVGYCDVSQQSIGAQIGGQSYTEIIALRTPEAVQKFKVGNTAFDAQASAVAVDAGSSSQAKFMNDVAVFISNESGLMAQASIGGQQISYQPKVK